MVNPDWWLWTFLLYAFGAAAAIDALWQGRTAQGTIAWVMGLLLIPPLALPLYAFFGSRRFYGYLRARRHGDHKLNHIASQLLSALEPVSQPADSVTEPLYNLFRLPLVSGNRCRLLTDGEETYDTMFGRIRQAEHYVFVQFYILRDDRIGQRLADVLCERAAAGVSVCLLYDEIGSHGLSRKYLQQLASAGVSVSRFNPFKLRNRMQLNFRNHRKLVICDGEYAYVGGYNVGEEHISHADYYWRDTHIEIHGPAVISFQLAFAEDWYWATRDLPDVNWNTAPARGDSEVLCVHSGPADETESASLLFTHLIHRAQKRCWLVSPYFVPDQSLISALQLAGLRGIDIRVLIPEKSDSWLVQQATRGYIEPLSRCNVRFMRYQRGILHQKVLLIDDDWSYVGSANLDNRSLRINFEIGALVRDQQLATEVEQMLLQDFADSEPAQGNQRWWPDFLSRTARLLAPLL